MFRNFINNLQNQFENNIDGFVNNVVNNINSEFSNNNSNNFNSTSTSNPHTNYKKFKQHLLFNINLDYNTCTICLENLNQGDIAIILHCNHIFHQDCINPWLKKDNSCPNCRVETDFRFNELSKENLEKQINRNLENIYFGNNTAVDLSLIEKINVKKLKFLLDEFNINYKNCITKDDLKDLIYNEIFFLNKSNDFIKKFLIENNIDISSCLERKEFLKLIATLQLIKRIYN